MHEHVESHIAHSLREGPSDEELAAEIIAECDGDADAAVLALVKIMNHLISEREAARENSLDRPSIVSPALAGL